MDSKTDHLEVTEEANVDEAILIYLKNNKAQKHIKKQQEKILITFTLMKLEPKRIQQNGGQYMK